MLPVMTAAMLLGIRRRPAAAGATLGLATLTKQTAAVTLLPLVFLAWRVRRWRSVAALGAAFAAPIVLAAAVFGPHDFTFWVFTGNGGYADIRGVVGYTAALGARETGWFLFGSAALVVLLPFAWRARRADRDLWLWLASGVIAVAIGFRFFPHYYLQLLPPLALLATRGVDVICAAAPTPCPRGGRAPRGRLDDVLPRARVHPGRDTRHPGRAGGRAVRPAAHPPRSAGARLGPGAGGVLGLRPPPGHALRHHGLRHRHQRRSPTESRGLEVRGAGRRRRLLRRPPGLTTGAHRRHVDRGPAPRATSTLRRGTPGSSASSTRVAGTGSRWSTASPSSAPRPRVPADARKATHTRSTVPDVQRAAVGRILVAAVIGGLFMAGCAASESSRIGACPIRPGAACSGNYMKGAQLAGAGLFDADFDHADLTGVDLVGADLSGATMTGAHLNRARLRDATLSYADLSGADLTGAEPHRRRPHRRQPDRRDRHAAPVLAGEALPHDVARRHHRRARLLTGGRKRRIRESARRRRRRPGPGVARSGRTAGCRRRTPRPRTASRAGCRSRSARRCTRG